MLNENSALIGECTSWACAQWLGMTQIKTATITHLTVCFHRWRLNDFTAPIFLVGSWSNTIRAGIPVTCYMTAHGLSTVTSTGAISLWDFKITEKHVTLSTKSLLLPVSSDEMSSESLHYELNVAGFVQLNVAGFVQLNVAGFVQLNVAGFVLIRSKNKWQRKSQKPCQGAVADYHSGVCNTSNICGLTQETNPLQSRQSQTGTTV